MFEQMLKEMLIRLINEDSDVRTTIVELCREDVRNWGTGVKYIIENDESVQDVIRKQATTDIWEAIEEEVDTAIVNAIDELVVVRR